MTQAACSYQLTNARTNHLYWNEHQGCDDRSRIGVRSVLHEERILAVSLCIVIERKNTEGLKTCPGARDLAMHPGELKDLHEDAQLTSMQLEYHFDVAGLWHEVEGLGANRSILRCDR